MHYNLAINLAAFVVVFYSWFYIFGLHRHSAPNRAFLLFTGVLGIRLALELVTFMPAARGHIKELVHAQFFFWEWAGVLALLFVSRFVKRKLGPIFWLGVGATAIASAICGFTEIAIVGIDDTHPWGYTAIFNGQSHAYVSMIPGSLAVLSFVYLLTAVFRTRQRRRRKPILVVAVGAMASILIVLFFNILLPDFFGISHWPRIGPAAMVIWIACVFIAVTRFNFISLSVENVAEEFFEDVDEGIALVGVDGQINKLNKKAREILAFDTRTLTGQTAEEVIPGYKPGEMSDTYKVSMYLDGEHRHLSINQSHIQRNDLDVTEIVLIRDITEIENAEELLKQANARLEAEVQRRATEIKGTEKMEAIGTLAGGVAHDFNNLLTAILVFAGGARDDLPEGHPNIQDLDEVLVAAKRARDISKQLLVFSRRETTKRIPINVVASIKDAIQFLEAGMPSRIRVQQQVDTGTDEVKVLGDSTNTRQALVNVLTNAYQSMPERTGQIVVRIRLAKTEEISPSIREMMIPGRYVLIEIADEGCGIPKDSLSKVFEPMFSQSKASTATGLGLTTTKRIISEMGGTVDIDSVVGQGTTFKIYLPSIDSLLPGKNAGASASLVGGNKRICWVDDHEQVPRVGQRFLEPLGYSVSAFNDPQDALRAIQADPHYFDILISDISMPGLSGIELTRKALAFNRDLPVILLTGAASAAVRRDAAALGVKHFLEKPFDIKSLEAALVDVFGAEAARMTMTGRGTEGSP